MHGPSRVAVKRSRSAQPFAGGAGDVEAHGHELRLDGVRRAAVVEGLDCDEQVEPAPLAGGEPEAPEIEEVGALGMRALF